MFLEGLGRMVEAVPAQAVEAAGSGVAVHYSLTTPARGGKKRMKCVINCSMLLSTVHGRRRRTVFVQMYCEIFPSLTRHQTRYTAQNCRPAHDRNGPVSQANQTLEGRGGGRYTVQVPYSLLGEKGRAVSGVWLKENVIVKGSADYQRERAPS